MSVVRGCVVLLGCLGFTDIIVAQPESPDPVSFTGETPMGNAKNYYQSLVGEWHGSYSLWLRPGAPARESSINASFKSVVNGNYFLMHYSWGKEDDLQRGVFLLGGQEQAVTATWGDSFYSAPNPMHCKDELNKGDSKLVLNGNYAAGEGPDWGWRTEFTRKGPNSLLMEAFNITPDGLEGLAVRAEMERVK